MLIRLRKANKKDIAFLFRLRNQPSTFRYAKNPRPVERQEHINWATAVLEGKTNKNLFIIEVNKKRAGQIRMDIDKKEATVSISLMPEFQGRGIGFLALQMAIKKMRKEKNVQIFTAHIHQDNIPSQKLFTKLGFQLKKQKGVWKQYGLRMLKQGLTQKKRKIPNTLLKKHKSR